jgi:hypothetical protein
MKFRYFTQKIKFHRQLTDLKNTDLKNNKSNYLLSTV